MEEVKMEKPQAFKSLRATLVVAFLLVSLVVLLTATGLELLFNFQAQQKLIANQQSLIVQQAAETVKRFVQEKFDLLKSSVNFGNLTASSLEEKRQVLAKSIGLDPSIRQLILFDAQGLEIARVSRASETESLKVKEWLKIDEIISQTKEGKDYLSQTYIYENTSEPMMIIAVPLRNIFGEFQGILVGEANLKFLWDVVDQIEIGKNGVAYVVDRQGNLIAFGDISRVLKGENLSSLAEVKEYLSNQGTVDPSAAKVAKGINGTYAVNTHVSLGAPDWAVVVEQPVAEAYQSIIQLLIFAGVVFILSLVIAYFSGLFFSKRISEPITSLRNAALNLSQGNLDTRIDIKSRDEIGELGGAFNNMAQKVQASYQEMQREVQERTAELTEAKGSLEKQVAERTAELTQAKATLEKQVAERTAQLNLQLTQAKRFTDLTVGRELEMSRLKKENEELKRKFPEASIK